LNINITPLLTQAYQAFQNGQVEIAENLVIKVIGIQPANFDALYLSGIINGLKGQHDVAAKALKKAVSLVPKHAFAHYNLAKAFMEQGRDKDAAEHLIKSIKLEPKNPEAELNLGLCLMKLSSFDEALVHLNRAINLKPLFVEALVNQAICLIELGDIDHAVEIATIAANTSPNNDACWSALGAAHYKNNNPIDAINYYQKAIELNHHNFKHQLSIAKCYKNNGNMDKAITAYQSALLLNPTNVDCLNSLATIYIRQENFDDALPLLNKALESEPKNCDVHLNLSIFHFLRFDLDSGWKEYEQRDEYKFLHGGPFPASKRKWKRSDLQDRLLIWGEQGVGDQIIYASMLDDASKNVYRIQVGIDDRLINLLKRSHPKLDIISIKQRPANSAYDSYLPIASLGQYFRNLVTDFPTPKSFLMADIAKVEIFKNQTPKNKLICGISWQSKNNSVAESKSMPASLLAPTLKLSGTHFMNLQYSTDQEDLEIFAKYQAPIQAFGDLDTFNDLDGLAAAIMACDVVVTVSNTTAHLAGALGKETLLLLSHSVGRFWYWNEYEGRNLWYPNIKVFQQRTEGDWSHPLAALQQYLEAKVG
jgi:tetratricopeptide (TPR) repeat protein/ADP-heptose:LPS heptosyltransferase